ncbi:MAG: leucine-rich repeat domain-containing protein [Clostridia bacterium]|nr:leucine-rich repeat domain-containing protein [Clostridia bacterium]
MKKFFVTFFSLLCVLASAVGLAACGGSTEGGKPHEHVFSSQWSHNETHHWHAATCEHTDEVKDKAEHDFANGECVCGYKLPDKTAALISFFEKNFADKVFGDKTVYAQTAYADEENDALKGITVVYTYEITEVFRAVELAQLSFEPIAVADIISGSAAAPQSELTRTTVFEFDAKDNYNRQDVADAVYAVLESSTQTKLFSQTESPRTDYERMTYLENIDNNYTVHQFDVRKSSTDEGLIKNLSRPSNLRDYIEVSSHKIKGTIFYEKNYEYEKLDQVKIRYNAIKENNETVGFKLSEIYDKTVTSLEIPAEYYGKPVTELAEGVFDGCDALQSITVDENNDSFASADGILYNKEKTQILAVPQAITGKVTLADGITELAANAFANRTALTQIVLPSGLQTIGDSAFKGCSFTEVSLPESVTQAYGAFTDCNALEKFSLPACGNILGYYFGTNEYSQQKDNIPDSLKTVIISGGDTVTDYAFYGCGLLESVTIPDSVTTIGEYAFASCSALESVTIPDSVSTVGSSAFLNCKSFFIITIPENVKSMGSYVFDGCDFTLVLCKAPSTPSGWNADFARGALAVIYDCDNNDTDADGAMYTVQNGMAYKIKDNAASVVAARIAADGIAVVPESITHKNVAYTVTSIGTVFKDNKQLKELTLGSGIINLANNAFERCERLERITVSAENPSYVSVDGILYNKAKTEIIHIPRAIKGAISVLNGVRTVDVAWRYNITSINIPDSATNVLPMEGCNSLERITVSAGNKQYTSVDGILCFKQSYNIYHVPQAMKGAVTLPVGAQAIGNSMFANRGAITSIIIPDTVKSIGTYAFDGCSSLTSIIIPNSVTSIGQHAFEGCSRLTSVTLSNSLTSIGDYMFRNCKSLTSIIIPNSVTRIGEAAFRSCSSLTSITIPESVKFIGQVAFDGCSSLTSITIPDSVTSIGDGAFNDCSSLTSITIPDSVTSIGDNMFSGCSSLTNITIPDGVTTIGIYAFRSCSSLTSIIIPDSVTSIGEAAFNDCSSLTSITFNGTKAQWNAISKDNYWNYNTGNYTIHCTDGDIAKAN